MANEVWRVLDTLPPKYRAVVHLHYVEGYSTEEIAEIAKCRPIDGAKPLASCPRPAQDVDRTGGIS